MMIFVIKTLCLNMTMSEEDYSVEYLSTDLFYEV